VKNYQMSGAREFFALNVRRKRVTQRHKKTHIYDALFQKLQLHLMDIFWLLTLSNAIVFEKYLSYFPPFACSKMMTFTVNDMN
jgi:hypothetical protein